MTSKIKKTPTTETVSKEEAVLIYVGPTNKCITRYTVYKNGYPVHFKAQLEEFSVLKNLFIHPSKLSEFEVNILQVGTVENIWFKEAQKYFNKAVK